LAEAGADPARQPPVERRVAGVAWQHRVGGGEPFEEQVERRRTSRPHRVREADAVRAQAIARDLVDEHGVQVVHRGVPVAAERVGGDSG
jgi:hypothetical protein